MATMEKRIRGMDIMAVSDLIRKSVMGGSISASEEAFSRFNDNGAACCVLVFERYSWFGGNRLSLNVTLFQAEGGDVFLSATASGGSQAMFFKINTFGEEAFLDKLRKELEGL